jgi:uncharacterized protein YutE (UPF0331/DUF86 family)
MKPSHLESLSKLLRKNRETLSSLERALKMPEWNEFETMGIGVLLSDIYQGVEQILVMLIEKVHSRKLVKDESWHDTLLSTARQMELIPEEIQRDLRGMLRYRHVQRHGYGIDLDGGKIRRHAPEAAKAYMVFERHLPDRYPELRAFLQVPEIQDPSAMRPPLDDKQE